MRDLDLIVRDGESICKTLDNMIDNETRFSVDCAHEIAMIVSNFEMSIRNLKEIREYYGV